MEYAILEGYSTSFGSAPSSNHDVRSSYDSVVFEAKESMPAKRKSAQSTADNVAKLWRECKTLQSAGISYHNYVTELTYLLFLKMLEETKDNIRIDSPYTWSELAAKTGEAQLIYYKKILDILGNPKKNQDRLTLAIFKDARTHIRTSKDLNLLVVAINKLDWFSARADGLGDIYEGLLDKTTSATKVKAGQYFTPRPLIDSIVRLIAPKVGEVVQDPAAGTGGFLIAADRYIKDHTDNYNSLSIVQREFQKFKAFVGNEWVQDTHRLCLMNLLLHGIQSQVNCTDTLSDAGDDLGSADIVLSNPPFNKMTGLVDRESFTITAGDRVGPLPFVEHAIRALRPGGRAAVIVPDNVLFGGSPANRLRTWLMDLCDLHTVLRLPSGIFYAQGVQTNVLFFSRGFSDVNNTQKVWFYDMRTNMPNFGKKNPLTESYFSDFEKSYKSAIRVDQGELGRFRCVSRDEIRRRDDNLDITWLKSQDVNLEQSLSEPEEIAVAIIGHLRNALDEVESLIEDLENPVFLE